MSSVEKDTAPKLLYTTEAPFQKQNRTLFLPVLSRTPALSV